MFNNLKSQNKINYLDKILKLKTIQQLRTCSIEKIYAIFLKKDKDNDFSYSPIVCFEYGYGNENEIFTNTYNPKEIPTLNKSFAADAVIMVHNHPKIDGKFAKAYPSKNDIISTIQTGEMWQEKGCFLLDHIIINEIEHYSFIENNLIKINI